MVNGVCSNCEKPVQFEYDVWSQCPHCGAGFTYQPPVTPSEAEEHRKMMEDMEKRGNR